MTKFDRWYQAYPRKRSKGEARKAFKALSPDPELLERMINAAEALRAHVAATGTDMRFVPYPATWIRAEGWEDELEAPQQNWKEFAQTKPELEPRPGETSQQWEQRVIRAMN